MPYWHNSPLRNYLVHSCAKQAARSWHCVHPISPKALYG